MQQGRQTTSLESRIAHINDLLARNQPTQALFEAQALRDFLMSQDLSDSENQQSLQTVHGTIKHLEQLAVARANGGTLLLPIGAVLVLFACVLFYFMLRGPAPVADVSATPLPAMNASPSEAPASSPSAALASAPTVAPVASSTITAEQQRQEAARRAQEEQRRAAEEAARRQQEEKQRKEQERLAQLQQQAREKEERRLLQVQQCVSGRIVVALGSGETRHLAFQTIRLTTQGYDVTVSESDRDALDDTDKDNAADKISALTRLGNAVKQKDSINAVAVTKSDADGNFVFRNLPSGSYYVFCDASVSRNYIGWSVPAVVPHGGRTTIELNNTNCSYAVWVNDTIY
jgi:hypothetical protein